MTGRSQSLDSVSHSSRCLIIPLWPWKAVVRPQGLQFGQPVLFPSLAITIMVMSLCSFGSLAVKKLYADTQPGKPIHIHAFLCFLVLRCSNSLLSVLSFPSSASSPASNFLTFLRVTWLLLAQSQFLLLWRSPAPGASSGCRGRRSHCHWGHQSSFSFGHGTKRGCCWPLTSQSKRERSGCTSATPGSICWSSCQGGPRWSSLQVQPPTFVCHEMTQLYSYTVL